jgi:four helix bundle protein
VVAYKFEQLDVWKLALDYIDLVYKVAENLPRSEDFNLKSQITRAATSIALNIAEGSQGQSDAEQARFLGMAIRSLIETVACQQIIRRRGYFRDETLLKRAYEDSQILAKNYRPSANQFHLIKSKKNHLFMRGRIDLNRLLSSIVYGPSSCYERP